MKPYLHNLWKEEVHKLTLSLDETEMVVKQLSTVYSVENYNSPPGTDVYDKHAVGKST